jgi:predicted GNAT superfamily acetyltransferase
MTNLVIRDIGGRMELRAVEELQGEVWGVPDLDVVPLTQLVAVRAAGGVLLGAFDDDVLAGFVYGFTGYEDGRVSHHSHMLAVRPLYRNYDLGRRLKTAQRERVLAQGIETMTWTYDPLQSLNAHFNFAKLGVVSNRYLIDFYGDDASSFLHRTGTDRLWVTWDLTADDVGGRIDKTRFEAEFEGIAPLVAVGDEDFPLAVEPEAGLQGERALIEIPSDINDLVKKGDGAGQKWRAATRRAFTAALARGFLVEGFRRTERGGVYLLGRV